MIWDRPDLGAISRIDSILIIEVYNRLSRSDLFQLGRCYYKCLAFTLILCYIWLCFHIVLCFRSTHAWNKTSLTLLLLSYFSRFPSRPSVQKQGSWRCGNAAWKSPTKTSKSPRRTSFTRSRRARRRAFTFNNQTVLFFFSSHPRPTLFHLLVWKNDSSWIGSSDKKSFHIFRPRHILLHPTSLLPLCVKAVNKSDNWNQSWGVSHHF